MVFLKHSIPILSLLCFLLFFNGRLCLSEEAPRALKKEPDFIPVSPSTNGEDGLTSSDEATIRIREARELLRRERIEESLRIFSNCLLSFPDHPEARDVFLMIVKHEQDLDRTIAFILRLMASHPEAAVARFAYFKLGEIYLMKSEHEKALSAFSDFLHLNPADPDREKARYYLSVCLSSLGRYQRALDELESLRRTSPRFAHSPELMDSIAVCQIELGRSEEAVRSLRYIISKFPNYPYLSKCYLSLGLCYEDMGNYLYAGAWYSELLRLFPDSLESHFAMMRLEDIKSTFPFSTAEGWVK